MIVCFPVIGIGQVRTFRIIGVSASSSYYNMATSPGKIVKADMVITIKDSTYTITAYGKTNEAKIIKKKDDNYFVISDGIKEAIITIGEMKSKKYSGFISQESDGSIVACYFKN